MKALLTSLPIPPTPGDIERQTHFLPTGFNCRVQERESVEQFITSLYNLVETCDFEDPKNKMICDRIIFGIWNQLYLSTSKRWQTSPCMEKVKTLVQQREVAHEHLNSERLVLSKVDKSLDSVQKPAFNSWGKSHFPKKGQSASKGPIAKCTRRGRGPPKTPVPCKRL